MKDMTFDFTKEEDRKKACEEYAKNYQNQLSLNAENRMTILKENAKQAGFTFSMTNESAYMHPRALVKPVFELIPLEQNVELTDTDFEDAVANIQVDDNGIIK